MLSPVVTESPSGLFLLHALVLKKIIIEFFPKRQNPHPAHARQGRISFLNSAVPPTFGLLTRYSFYTI